MIEAKDIWFEEGVVGKNLFGKRIKMFRGINL